MTYRDKYNTEIEKGDILSSGMKPPRICEVFDVTFKGETIPTVRYKPHDFLSSLASFMYYNHIYGTNKTHVQIVGHILNNPEILD